MLIVNDKQIRTNFFDVLRRIQQRSKQLVNIGGELQAFDTGDMWSAIKHTDIQRIKYNRGKLEGRVYVSRSDLGAKRGGNFNKNYPIHVANGSAKMKARPFLLRATIQIEKEDGGAIYSDNIIRVKKK